MLKDKLQIFLVTYNRKTKLQFTLDELLKSPVANYDITVLDNASTDGTSQMLDEYAKKYENITHIRHKVNIGGNANICRAFEMAAACGHEYAWILCDDDRYDFSNYSAIEKAIEQKPDLICVADYIYPDKKTKTDPVYQIFQMTFVPATIFKTSLITDGVLMNMYDSIYTMFQQSCVTINVINNGGSIFVLDKPIVFNGLHFEEKIDSKDVSYVRGTNNKKEILARRKDTVWVLGFCNVISLLKDKKLQIRCMDISIPYKDIYATWDNFYNCMMSSYITKDKFNYFYEIYQKLPQKHQKELLKKYKKDIEYILRSENLINRYHTFILPKRLLKKIPKFLLSIDISKDWQYRILRILGCEIKLHRINETGKK